LLSRLFKRLLGDADPAATRSASLAVFGKHPGWNDHLDDQGLDTAALVALKRTLYLEGLARNIDAGNWEALAPEKRLSGFDHALLVQSPEAGLMLGRIWASSDGRGRRQYPMIAVAQVTGVPRSAAIAAAWPVVREVESACRATAQAPQVIAAVDAGRAKLQGQVAQMPSAVDPGPDLDAVRRLRASAGLDNGCWPRILYRFEDALNAGQWRVAAGRGEHVPPGTDLRVPAGPGEPPENLAAWAALVEAAAGRVPAYLFAPAGNDWVDIFLHAPSPQQIFALQTNTQRIPLVTDIPFTLDPAFEQRAAQWP
jgi:hypothetical protein